MRLRRMVAPPSAPRSRYHARSQLRVGLMRCRPLPTRCSSSSRRCQNATATDGCSTERSAIAISRAIAIARRRSRLRSGSPSPLSLGYITASKFRTARNVQRRARTTGRHSFVDVRPSPARRADAQLLARDVAICGARLLVVLCGRRIPRGFAVGPAIDQARAPGSQLRRACARDRRSVERRASSAERRASSVERRASSVEPRASSVERRA